MKISRVSTAIALLLTLCIIQPATGQAPVTTASANPDHITLTWTGNPATTMAITWRTDATVSAGFIQYQEGTDLSEDALKTEAQSRDFKTDLGETRLFTSNLTDLAPNTQYTYRVGNGSDWSKQHTFMTADPEAKNFKFLVFGDSQSHATGEDPYGLWRDTVHNAFKANPDARFFVNVGDLVDFGQQEAHWNAWFAAAKGVIDTIPAMPATGNHESYGSRETWKPAYFTAQFSLPQNGPASLKNQAYTFNYGPVHFVVLDSQGAEQKQYGDILSIQQSWLESNLSTSDAAWKIAFFHRSPYGVKLKRDEAEVRDAFCPILERNGANLVFNAHDHGIKRTHPIKNGIDMKNPSEGTTYYVTGRSGEKTYEDVEEKEHSAFFYVPLDQPNYFVVEGTEQTISVKAVLQDGTVIDTYTIEKPENDDPPMGTLF